VDRIDLEWHQKKGKWKVSGTDISSSSGFVLQNFPDHIVTAGHALHQFNGKHLSIPVQAWVIPGNRVRPLPLKDQKNLEKFLSMGAIPVRAWKSLVGQTMRRRISDALKYIRDPDSDHIRDDIALLHVGEAIRDFQEPLHAAPEYFRAQPDNARRMGLLLGNPCFQPSLRIPWPAYSTWVLRSKDRNSNASYRKSSNKAVHFRCPAELERFRGSQSTSVPRSAAGREHFFKPTPAIQAVDGRLAAGMSGGPVVAHLAHETGISLCLNIELSDISL
jgi:hypothetical protein